MKELVAYLTQNMKMLLLLGAVLVAAVFVGTKTLQVFPPGQDPFGATETQDLPVSPETQPAPALALANALAEWGWPEDCQESPNLRLAFDLENTAAEALPLPGPDLGLLLLVFIPSDQGTLVAAGEAESPRFLAAAGVSFPHAVGSEWLVQGVDGNAKVEAGDLIGPGNRIHYEGVAHPDFAWHPSGVENSATTNQASPGSFSDGSLLILGLPDIAGLFEDTAEGETGGWPPDPIIDLKPLIGDLPEIDTRTAAEDPLLAFAFSLKIDDAGSPQGEVSGLVILPSEVNYGNLEYPNLVFHIPESAQPAPEDPPNGLFVLTSPPPPAWSGISQFQVTDFEFLQRMNASRLSVSLVPISPAGDGAPCILAASPTAEVTATVSTPTRVQFIASATPRPTEIPTRTPKPTERDTPRPPPRPTETPK